MKLSTDKICTVDNFLCLFSPHPNGPIDFITSISFSCPNIFAFRIDLA